MLPICSAEWIVPAVVGLASMATCSAIQKAKRSLLPRGMRLADMLMIQLSGIYVVLGGLLLWTLS